jgi:hypothetical protein
MKDLASTQPMTDAEYEAEADRYLERIRALRQRENERHTEFQRNHAEITEMLADIRNRLQRMK